MQTQLTSSQLQPTFTHLQPLQYNLTGTLSISSNLTGSSQNSNSNNIPTYPPSSLHLHLLVPTDTFPKIYELTLNDSTLPLQFTLIFENIVNLYKVMKEKTNLEILYSWGLIRVKYEVVIAGRKSAKSVQIKMERSLENQLEEIRSIVGQKIDGLTDFQCIDNRIDKVWKRIEQNQKIYMKFKQDIEFKVEQALQRMQIQSTKMSILREDINKLTNSFDKLSNILCPIFSKLNMNPQHTGHFILQDRKIMYIGQNSVWTQILFKNQLAVYKKYEIGFKIVNSKRCNVVAGITVVGQANWRSAIGRGDSKESKNDKDRKYVGLSGLGHLYTGQHSVSQLKNILVPQHHESQKQRDFSRQKQSKSSYEITLSSPIPSSMKSSGIGSKHHHLHSQYHSSPSGASFKPMQIIKMCIELDRQKIYWKNGSKVLMETKIGQQFKNQPIVPYFQFFDTGDSIELVDL